MTRVDPENVIDLQAVEQELADVEAALERLDNGTYWTDEVTGAPIDTAWLETNPLARRAPGNPTLPGTSSY